MLRRRTVFAILLAATLVALIRSCGIPANAPRKTPPKGTLSRISYGWEAKPNSLPWMVFIIILKEEEEVNCAGFLVDSGSEYQSDIVVTAAHCISSRTKYYSPSKVHVVLGAHELRNIEPAMVYRSVKNYATHFYNYDDDDNDITLLKLTSPVNYTKEVSPICLPTKHTVDRALDTCFAAGWGRTEDEPVSMVLKQTRVRIVPISYCYSIERKHRALCIREYYKRSTPCVGDSGGPLFCEVDGRYFAFGSLSLAPTKCAQQDGPSGLYVRMDSYHDWILETMKLLKTSSHRSEHNVSDVNISVNSKLTVPGLLSLVPKRDKSKSLTALELIAVLSGYRKRPNVDYYH